MSDMGSLFYCRCPLRTGHAITRDRPKSPRGVRIEESGSKDTQTTRSAGKIQLPDGLASAHEHRCGAYMAAECDSGNGDGALVRVGMGVLRRHPGAGQTSIVPPSTTRVWPVLYPSCIKNR